MVQILLWLYSYHSWVDHFNAFYVPLHRWATNASGWPATSSWVIKWQPCRCLVLQSVWSVLLHHLSTTDCMNSVCMVVIACTLPSRQGHPTLWYSRPIYVRCYRCCASCKAERYWCCYLWCICMTFRNTSVVQNCTSPVFLLTCDQCLQPMDVT